MGIHGLAWGTVVGGLLHILIQTPALARYRIGYRPALGLSLPGVQEIVRLMGPRIVTLGTIQLADLFIIRLTSGMAEGSTSGYFYGYYLQQLPETLFGTAIGIVVFPTLAELYNKGQIEQLKRTAMNALKVVWTLTIPAGAALVLLGRPAIAVFLQRGAFDERSTTLVYFVLVFFSVRVVSEATLEIVARLFYAQHNTRTPMYAALVWLFVTVPLSFAFVGELDTSFLFWTAVAAFLLWMLLATLRRQPLRRHLLPAAAVIAVGGGLFLILDRLIPDLGIGGLALASTVGFTVQSALLFILNRRTLGSLFERELAAAAGRALLATFGMSVVILLVRDQMLPRMDSFVLSLERLSGGRLIEADAFTIAFLLTGAAAGLAAYVLLNLILGGRELPSLIRLLRPGRATS
jgi:peptidoglycan biosynthesis protein MviN/MurJ (putative lipid II flippase)